MTKEIRQETRQGVYVYLWLPPEKIVMDSYLALKEAIVLNTLRSVVSPSGSHKSQGHAMIRFKFYPGLGQKWFGKTTRDTQSDTEKLWMQTLIDNETQDGGVEKLVTHGSLARFQTLKTLRTELKEPRGRLQKWYFRASGGQAAAGVKWINESNRSGAGFLQGDRWGFNRGCTNWVHGALDAAGILDDALAGYQQVYVHKDVWKAKGASLTDRDPWKNTKKHGWIHPLDFLTPRLFRKKLKAVGFAGGDVT